MAKTNFKSIDEYQATFSTELQVRMQTIRNLINKIVPEVEEIISYQIPCFKYKGYLIYYAAYPNHISLSNPFSQEILKNFEKELKNYKVSKSAIQFPNKNELPLDLIKGIVEFRKMENEAKSKTNK